VFEKRVLRRIFGPRRDEVIRGWRKLHNEDEMCRACSKHGEKRNACRILAGKREGKRPLGRPRFLLEDNIKMDRRDIRWGGIGWIHLSQIND
jgi:hypothetical protein